MKQYFDLDNLVLQVMLKHIFLYVCASFRWPGCPDFVLWPLGLMNLWHDLNSTLRLLCCNYFPLYLKLTLAFFGSWFTTATCRLSNGCCSVAFSLQALGWGSCFSARGTQAPLRRKSKCQAPAPPGWAGLRQRTVQRKHLSGGLRPSFWLHELPCCRGSSSTSVSDLGGDALWVIFHRNFSAAGAHPRRVPVICIMK